MSARAQTVMARVRHSDEGSGSLADVDHLLYATTDLQRGMDEIEALLGVRPVQGGRHPQYGTHNALLSIGPGMYLEVIARDPELASPERGPFVDIPAKGASRLLTWVLRTTDIQESSAAARDAGIGLGAVVSGSRTNPDGSELRWQVTDPYATPMGGAVPFLISWGNTPHPSAVAPSGGRLVELLIEHPDADRVRDAFSVLGANIPVINHDEFRICANIESKNGLVTLR